MSSLSVMTSEREALVRRGLRLGYATIGYNSVEGVMAIATGLAAGSVALVGFGVDSLIELTAGAAAIWRLHSDLQPVRRERAELITLRIIGACFIALAVYVTVDATRSLLGRVRPAESIVGIVIAALSLLVMPLLARGKRQVAAALDSAALAADAQQTAFCTYLSAILLAGLALNAALGWWWADPAAALVMVPLIAKEGVEGIRGRSSCSNGCP